MGEENIEEGMPESIVFVTDDGEEINFVILDSVKHNDKEYILVTEDPDAEEIEVQILCLDNELTDSEDDDESVQIFKSVVDFDELQEVSRLFSSRTEGEEIEIDIVK